MSDPSTQKQKRRFYYGWVIVAIFILTGITQSGQFNLSMGLFIKPISEDFGWNRSVFVGALSVGSVLGGVTALLVGPALDRFGPRYVVTGGFLLAGGGLLGLTFAHGLWQFYLVIIFMRLGLQGVLNIATAVTVPKWFVRKRGRALAVAGFGSVIGNGTTPIFSQALITQFSWRVSAFTLGLIALLTMIPAAVFLRRRPEDMGLRPDGDLEEKTQGAQGARLGAARVEREEVSFTLRQTLRAPKFYLVLTIVSMGLFVVSGVSLNFLAYVSDQGLSPGSAVFLVTVWSFLASAGSLTAGTLADRFPLRFIMGVTYLGLAATMLLLLNIDTLSLGMLFAVPYGLLFGAQVTLQYLVYPTYFGRRSLGAISGVTQMVQTVVIALGPLAAAVMFDATGEYNIIFMIFMGLLSVAGVAAFLAKPPKEPLANPA